MLKPVLKRCSNEYYPAQKQKNTRRELSLTCWYVNNYGNMAIQFCYPGLYFFVQMDGKGRKKYGFSNKY
jgi:hypothetical protein